MVLLRALLHGSLLWIALGGTLSPVHAQPRQPDHARELGVIETTERGEDPLGIDVATGAELDEAAKRIPKPAVPLPTPSQGAALSALPRVRETGHTLQVRLEQGLALVEERSQLFSGAQHVSEVSLRWALPEGAVLTALTLCPTGQACLEASPSQEEAGLPYTAWLGAEGAMQGAGLWARLIRDAQGLALALRAAPIRPAETLEIVLRYAVEAPVRSGRAQVRLPARGEDPNLARSAVAVMAPGNASLSTPDSFDWDPALPLTLGAELVPAMQVGPLTTRARCGRQSCSRSFTALGSQAVSARATWLWIDASPSMEGPARGRVDAVLSALLARLPPETELAVYAFAGRAALVGRFQAGTAPLSALADATLLELDAATRPASVVALTAKEIARVKPRILVLSDGLLDPGAEQTRALESARRHGADLWLLTVGDGAPLVRSFGTQVIPLAQDAEAALRGLGLEALSDGVGAALSTQHGALRAGEQRVEERTPASEFWPHRGDPWLAYWLSRERLENAHWLGLRGQAGPEGGPLPIAALPYQSAVLAPAPALTAMPAESVLDMLRTQLVPRARACLRSDRKGRGDYAVELVFRALFARREVSDTAVEGEIPAPLRACLEDLLPKLKVPAFSGGVRVRYPIHTQREAPPPVVELTPELHEQVKRVLATPLAPTAKRFSKRPPDTLQ